MLEKNKFQDLVTILQRPFFILLHKSIRFSDIMRFSDMETKSVIKSRLHCIRFLHCEKEK